MSIGIDRIKVLHEQRLVQCFDSCGCGIHLLVQPMRTFFQLCEVALRGSNRFGESQPLLAIVPSQNVVPSIVMNLSVVFLVPLRPRLDMPIASHGSRINPLKLFDRFACDIIESILNLRFHPRTKGMIRKLQFG